jgi:hypothetical protein
VKARPKSHVAVGVDRRFGDAGHGRLGQRPHGRGARDIGRSAEDAADREAGEARALQDIVIPVEGEDVERERRDEADGREVVDDHMDMRPELRRRLSFRNVAARGQVHAGADHRMQLAMADLPAELADNRHEEQRHERKPEHEMDGVLRQRLAFGETVEVQEGGDARCHQEQQRRIAPALVIEDPVRRRRVLRHRRVLHQLGNGAVAAPVGGDREDGDDAERQQGNPLSGFVVRRHRGDVKAEREDQSDERKDAHQHVQVRPGIWNEMHVGPHLFA